MRTTDDIREMLWTQYQLGKEHGKQEERWNVMRWLQGKRHVGHLEQACLEASVEIVRGDHEVKP